MPVFFYFFGGGVGIQGSGIRNKLDTCRTIQACLKQQNFTFLTIVIYVRKMNKGHSYFG